MRLNTTTTFYIKELKNPNTAIESGCHITYGNHDNTTDVIPSVGLTLEQFEQVSYIIID